MAKFEPILVKMTEEEIYDIIDKADAALAKGDEESYYEILKQMPLDPGQADILKDYEGIESLIAYGFNLSEAVETYGEEWLRN
jgi:hypothetical protein